jgi:hypothetical protein
MRPDLAREIADGAAIAIALAYIIENPVRKGIVQNPMEYPHWGSGIYSREELLYSIGLRRGSARRV